VEKNPDEYSSGITTRRFVIMERPYASAHLAHAVAGEREKLMPQVFEEARKNLRSARNLYQMRWNRLTAM